MRAPRRPRRVRPCEAAVGLALAVATFVSCSKDFVVVRLTSTERELTVAPLDVTVSVSGAGLRETFAYTATFAPPVATSGPVGASDFVVELGPGAGDFVDIAAFVPGSSKRWGGDTRVALPADGRTVDLALAAGELNIGPARVTEGDTQTSAPFAGGVILAWPDLDGVSTRIERDPDKPLQRSKLVVSEPNASSIRVASRPAAAASATTTSDPNADFAALVWHSENGTLGLRTFVGTTDGAPVTVGQGADIHVAVMPQGSPFDAVTISLESGRVWASFHDVSGADAFTHGAPTRVPVALGDKVTVRSLLGVVAGPDGTFLAAVRGGVEKSAGVLLLRVGVTGAIAGQTDLPGDVRALAVTAAGDAVIVATVDSPAPSGVLAVSAYDAHTLTPTRGPTALASARDLPTGALARVALAACVVVWPETRHDGTSGVELRYRYLDDGALPYGTAHRAGIALEGDAFAPTASCLAPTRAYVSFIARTDAAAFLGQLQLRRLPSGAP